jgi:acetyltransferase-like isoleucine patch superfamily enzyme
MTIWVISFFIRVLSFNINIRKVLLKRLAILRGMKIGKRTRFVGSHDFGTEPFLITVGDDCLIANDASFLTHDGAIQIPLVRDGSSFDAVYSKQSRFGKIIIGNNCFIGYRAILLPGTYIGDNTIVAAGSVVRGEFPSDVVIGGNPGKILQGLTEYESKNRGYIIDLTEKKKFETRKAKILADCSVIRHIPRQAKTLNL